MSGKKSDNTCTVVILDQALQNIRKRSEAAAAAAAEGFSHHKVLPTPAATRMRFCMCSVLTRRST